MDFRRSIADTTYMRNATNNLSTKAKTVKRCSKHKWGGLYQRWTEYLRLTRNGLQTVRRMRWVRICKKCGKELPAKKIVSGGM